MVENRYVEQQKKDFIESVQNSSNISEENKQIARDYIKYTDGVSESTKLHRIRLLSYLCIHMGKRCIKDATREDIANFLERYKRREFQKWKKTARITDGSQNHIKVTLKTVYKELFGMKKGEYPNCVSWLKVTRGNYNFKKEILSPDEIEKMAAQATNARDCAIVKVLYESAARVGELLNAKISDVKISGNEAKLQLDGKTGKRKVLLIRSLPELKDWLNRHPFKGEGDKPIFCNFNSKRVKGNAFTRVYANGIMKRLAKAAGIDKHVHPHILRHSRLTWLHKAGMPDMELKRFAGWSRTSNMASVYIHESESDVFDRIRTTSGEAPLQENEKTQPLKRAKYCNKCGSENPESFELCEVCGIPLTAEKAFEVQKELLDQHKMLEEFKRLEPMLKMMKSLQERPEFKKWVEGTN